MDPLQMITQLLQISQANRLLTLTFPNGDAPDSWLVVDSLKGHEGMSQDFEFTVKVMSDDPQIELKDVLGKLAVIELNSGVKSSRYFSGHIFEFKLTGTDGGVAHYTMLLKPWLEFLKLRTNNYIYHEETLAQQCDRIFKQYAPLNKWAAKLTHDRDRAMTDAIQYMETDYDYLHRRWQQRNWYYWYEHSAKGHTLHLEDYSKAAKDIEGGAEVIYQTDTGSADEDCINDFRAIRHIASTSYTVGSFDFKSPRRPVYMETTTVNKQGKEVRGLEIFDYGGTY